MNRAPMKTETVIVGAGGHAKVIIDLLRADGRFAIVGLIAPGDVGTLVNGVPVVGDDTILPRLRADGVTHAHVAIGQNQRRLSLARELEALGFTLASAISPNAVISPSVQIGNGVAIMAGAVVNADSTLGDACILNTNSSLDHDGWIGEGAHVAPGCALAGNVRIGRLAMIGVGTSILPGVEIGEEVVIGGGSCVNRPIAAGLKAFGVPARVRP